jgi:tetratricopeptide (TPR) repeat protein
VGRPDGNRPDIAKPDVTRPNVNKPDFIRPDVTRPDLTRPDLTRPDLTRPGGGGGGVNAGDRPSFGNLTKPAIDRPDNSRPNIGRPDGNRPDIVRPDNTRPNINRPDGNRPDFVRPDNTRPNVGRPDGLRPETRPAPVKPDRPLIGGNRPHVGDNHQFLNTNNNNIINNLTQNNVTQNNVTNIWGNNSNIGNNFTNRPSWDRPYYNRPNWGWGSNNWGDHWHSNCIHPHYNWYNGCWNGYWNSGWYSPLAWGAVGWGLGVWTTRWSSYTPVYYNPYYVANTATTPYNYSQPVVVNNYVSADGGSSTQSAAPAAAGQPPAPAGQQPAPQPPSPASSPGLAKFDDGLSSFKEGQYEAALASFDAALKLLPSDPVVHEIRALDLFALGNYSGAAASLNSLLTAAPGMDWTTMSSLYGDTDDYVAQLRKLEKHCQSEPTDAAAAFVLAYHYLVTGAKEEAIHALRAVVKNQPKDVTAKRMLDALAPPADVEPPKPGETQVAEKEPAEGKDEPETDLVGTWIAKADGAEIQLTITEDSTFTWKATQKDQPAIELSGDLNATGDAIVLESKSQGSMSGNVISKGADQWQFRLAGSPAKDPGLLFARSK